MDVDRAEAALPRLHDVLVRSATPGVVLTSPGSVAWATGGANPPVDRSAPVDVIWVAAGADGVHVITTDVEATRMRTEGPFTELGWPVVAVPWWEPDAFVRAAQSVLGHPASALGSDGHPAFGIDVGHDLTATRMALTPPDVETIRALAVDAAGAVEAALKLWHSGETDRVLAGRIAENVEAFGGCAPVLLVGGDDRLRQFRHPVATGAAIHDLAMAVLVASRGGLHVALTRYVGRPRAAAGLADDLATVRHIHAQLLKRCVPGVTAGAVLDELEGAYAVHGHPQAWRQHYQGGPIGFAQREFEIAPGQHTSQWWEHTFDVHTAVAWNPSLPGGAKDEDTYLLADDGIELLTSTGNWPTVELDGFTRPDVLLVEG